MGLPESLLWHDNFANRAQAHQLGKSPDDPGADPFPDSSMRLFDDLSPIAVDLAGYDQALRELENIHSRLVIHDLNLTAGTSELRQSAQAIAKLCRIDRGRATSLPVVHQACQAICQRYGVTPPPVDSGQW